MDELVTTLNRRLFAATAKAFEHIPAVLREVHYRVPPVPMPSAPAATSDDSPELAVIEVTFRAFVPQVLLDPALVEELRGRR